MKRKNTLALRIILPIATVVSMFFVPWDLLWAWLAPLPDSVQQQVEDAVDHGLDGIIVYVDKAGAEPTTYTAGWMNRDTRVPVKPQALFKIASINKLFVAVALAKMADAQMLSLDDTLSHYFPELQGRIEHANEITLKLMVNHRSGIPNYMDSPDYPWEDPPKTTDESLALILDTPADFAPDQGYNYSNTNYLLLVEIIDKVLGYDHDQYIKNEILEPLNLKNTFSSLNDVDLDDVMSGYFVGYGPDIKTNYFGSMVATAEDVGIFLRALNDGSLFNGNEEEIYSSIYEYGHTGLLPGYSSIARYHRDLDAVVVQFVNTSGGTTWSMTEIVYNRVVKILRTK
ncbi:MAG: beta-lactamase family protein [Rhodothermales bacterium]|nr:beta-lactamase family protein [Rhodothermales bacterium]